MSKSGLTGVVGLELLAVNYRIVFLVKLWGNVEVRPLSVRSIIALRMSAT